MRYIILPILFILVLSATVGGIPPESEAPVLALDKIYLFSGKCYTGAILSETDTRIIIQIDMKMYELDKRTVGLIIYANGDVKEFKDTRTTDQMIADTSWTRTIIIIVVCLLLLTFTT